MVSKAPAHSLVPEATVGRTGRAGRAIAAAAKALGLGVVFTLAVAGGLVLHAGLPAPRRIAAAQVSALLAGTFQGRIEIERVRVIRLDRIEGLDGTVFDPEGAPVIVARDVGARFGLWGLLRSLVGGDTIVVRLSEVTALDATVVLEENEAGELALARTFASRAPSTGGPPTKVAFTAADVRIRHVWVRGHMAVVPLIDADLEDLVGAFETTPETMDIEVRHARLRGRGLPGMNPDGTLVGRLSLPSDARESNQAAVHYQGWIGGIPVLAEGTLRGRAVAAVVDVAESTPDAISELTGGRFRPGAAVSGQAVVQGELPVLMPSLRLRIGDGDVTASGTVTLPEGDRRDLFAAVKADVERLDLQAVVAGAPASRLTTSVEASIVSSPGGKVAGVVHAVNEVGEVDGQVVPAFVLDAAITERSARGLLQIAERGAPTAVWFSLHPRAGEADGAPVRLDVTVDSVIPSLRAIERIGPIGRGRAHAVVVGSLDLDTTGFVASAAVEVAGLDVGGVRLSRGLVVAAGAGTLDSPWFVVHLRGGGLHAGGYDLTAVHASASGSPRALDVTARWKGVGDAPDGAARAHLTPAGGLTVSGARVDLTRGDVTATTRIRSVRVAGRTVDLRGVSIEGLGDPAFASARISAGGAALTARAENIDLARVAKLFLRGEEVRGALSFDVDAALRGRLVKGEIRAHVADLHARGIEGAAVHVAAALDGTKLRAEVQASLGEAGNVNVSARGVDLGGAVTDPSSWERATGTLAVAGTADLARVFALFAPGTLPLGAAAGVVTIEGDVARPLRSGRPSGAITVSTKGLDLSGTQEKKGSAVGVILLDPQPWRVSGLDAEVVVKVDAATDGVRLGAKVRDARAVLAKIDGTVGLPLAAIWADPASFTALAAAAPIDVTLDVPRRSMATMPEALRLPAWKGAVGLTGTLKGTAKAPALSVAVAGVDLLPETAPACVPGIGVNATIAYDGEAAVVHVTASEGRREVLTADAKVTLALAQALGGGAPAWEASGDVALTGFPLDTAGAFAELPLAGAASGTIALHGLHRAASLDVDLDLDALVVDRSPIPHGKIRVQVEDDRLSASVRLEQTDGFAEGTAKGTIAWGALLAPDVDLTKALEIELRATNFRANAVAPLLAGVLDDVDGRVDADAKVHVGPGATDGNMIGTIRIRDGVLNAPQIGERFHAVKGSLFMQPWGTVRLDDFSAEAPTGRVTGSASAVMKGFALQSAEASFHIAEGESLPIAIQGVPMGRAFGDISAKATMAPDGKRLDIDVTFPVLHARLPQSTGHVVQSLEADKTVRIGRRQGGDFTLLPLVAPEEPRAASDMAVRVTFTLGKEVDVKRDTTLAVAAAGKVVIDVRDKARVSGQIRLLRGKVELQGKAFVLDRGTVSFVGEDPSDPLIIATAYWDAPDGTRVYADFSGRVSAGKLALRSEPALAQDEILSLLLFGARDGSLGAESQVGAAESAGLQAAGMVGSVVTQALNKTISGITTADISTRIDTSNSASPRPELAVQITKSISARLGYKLGVPAPGENPDRTELTLDWRFVRSWSLVTVVGEQGSTAVDVVWRRRY